MTPDVLGRGDKLRSQFGLEWDLHNFSGSLFHLALNRDVHSWIREVLRGARKPRRASSTPSFNVKERSMQNKTRKASFPVPGPS